MLVLFPVPLQRGAKVAGRQQPKWGEDGLAGGLPSKVRNSGVPPETDRGEPRSGERGRRRNLYARGFQTK